MPYNREVTNRWSNSYLALKKADLIASMLSRDKSYGSCYLAAKNED